MISSLSDRQDTSFLSIDKVLMKMHIGKGQS